MLFSVMESRFAALNSKLDAHLADSENVHKAFHQILKAKDDNEQSRHRRDPTGQELKNGAQTEVKKDIPRNISEQDSLEILHNSSREDSDNWEDILHTTRLRRDHFEMHSILGTPYRG